MTRTSLLALIAGFVLVPTWRGQVASAEPGPKEPIPGFKRGTETDRVIPGQLIIDPPTLENLGFPENSRNWCLADNELTGINPTWYPRPGGGKYMEPSHTGINVYGQGIVVCYNRIERFSDSLAIANFGIPVEDLERHCVAVDFYGNDLSFAQDDCLETDYGCHNIRVYRNRCYNAHTGLSVQPNYGGPIYLIRNEVYGITALSFKLHNYCTGLEVYHNTCCCAGNSASIQMRALGDTGTTGVLVY